VRYTVKEVAEKLGVDEATADHLIKFMLGVKPPMAEFVGERPSPSKSGHGPKVYRIHTDAGIRCIDLAEKLLS
jgi:hypothetical protein